MTEHRSISPSPGSPGEGWGGGRGHSQPDPLPGPPPEYWGRGQEARHARMRGMAGYLFLAPYLLLFSVFLLFPLLYGLHLSLTKYELASPEMVTHRTPQFVGDANYVEALHDKYFWKALKTTCVFVLF